MDMFVTDETSHAPMVPLKEAAPSNMWDVSVTLERSGTSVAAYVILDASLNADAMVDQVALPHWSIERSLAALASPPPRWILVKSPEILTVWLPAAAYAWVASDVCVVTAVPSPQSTL